MTFRDLIKHLRRRWREPVLRGRYLAILGALFFVFVAVRSPDPWDVHVQRRLGAKANLKAEDYAVLVLTPVALANAVLCVVLAITAQYWARPLWGRGHGGSAGSG